MSDAAAPGGAVGPSWVGEALDAPGRWALRGRLPWLFGFVMLFDSWDSIVIAYTLPSIREEWGLSPIAAGWLVSAGYGGQLLGSILFGALGERRGRMPVLRPLVLAMGVLGIICALADSYSHLIALRLIQGLAIGGALPIATCYINEIAPTATRGRFFGTFQFLMVSGFGLASLSSAWIVPAFGWRAMFALGALPLLALPFLYLAPESPRWLAGRGRGEAAARALTRLGGPAAAPPGEVGTTMIAARVPVTELLAPAVLPRTLATAALWFLTALCSFGLVTWIPSLYVSLFKVPVADALRFNLASTLIVFVLPILLRQTIDRIGRRPLPMIGTLLGGLALLAIMAIPVEQRVLLIALSVMGQIGVSIGSMVLWPYTAETFETRIRSVALGTFGSLARGASMLTPLVVGGIMQVSGSATPVFWVFGIASLVVALLWWRCTVETAGKEMDG